MEFNLNLVDNINAELLNEAALSAQDYLTAFATNENFTVRNSMLQS